ncbi:MAG TPA: helix-turn-helix domain-containing protein [Pseudonocardia sp.]
MDKVDKTEKADGASGRADVLGAARREFVRRGFAGARIRDISAATGTTDAKIYRLFPSKQALFDEVLSDSLRTLVEQIRVMAAEFPTASRADRFQLARQTQERVLLLFEEIAPLLGVALFHDSEAGRRFYRDRLWPALAECADALGGVMTEQRKQRVDPRHLILAMVGMHLAAATARAQELDRAAGEDAVSDAITQSLAYGLDALLT